MKVYELIKQLEELTYKHGNDDTEVKVLTPDNYIDAIDIITYDPDLNKLVIVCDVS